MKQNLLKVTQDNAGKANEATIVSMIMKRKSTLVERTVFTAAHQKNKSFLNVQSLVFATIYTSHQLSTGSKAINKENIYTACIISYLILLK